jgi:hypothetical protein
VVCKQCLSVPGPEPGARAQGVVPEDTGRRERQVVL